MPEIKQIKTGGVVYDLAARTNRNLLINWDFKNPVNQRGVTDWQGIGYNLDGWRGNHESGRYSLTTDGLTMAAENSICYFCQWLETDYSNVELTLSCVENGTVYSVSRVLTKQASLSMTLPSGVLVMCTWDSNKSLYRVVFSIGAGRSTTISRVKLEVGAVSTISNDPPAEYGAELLRCQRYFQTFSSVDARPVYGTDCRPVMRLREPTKPAAITVNGVTYYCYSAEL